MDTSVAYENTYDDLVAYMTRPRFDSSPFYDQMFSVYPQNAYDNVTDTMYSNGVDIQGIIWSQQRMTREEYRTRRLMEYDSYLSLKKDRGDLTVEDSIKNQKVKRVQKNHHFYDFKFTKLNESCCIGHFQLRNLLSTTSKNTVHYIKGNTVRQWSPQRRTSTEILDLDTTHPTHYRALKISSMASKDNLVFVGGFLGDYVLKRLDCGLTHGGLISDQSTGIVNHADIVTGRNGACMVLVSDNDMKTRLLDVTTLNIEQSFTFPFPVNCSALSSDKRMMCVVGDSTETHLVDVSSGKVIKVIDEHHDYSFTCCYSPDGTTLATGNQDKTTRIYDVRNLSQSLHVLGANVGAIRSLHYSNDGKWLAMAESIDFVHLFDTSTDYEACQVIDFFGDIAGVAFTPDTQGLMIANSDDSVGGIIEYQRCQNEMPLFMI